jgi:hypothetical protein
MIFPSGFFNRTEPSTTSTSVASTRRVPLRSVHSRPIEGLAKKRIEQIARDSRRIIATPSAKGDVKSARNVPLSPFSVAKPQYRTLARPLQPARSESETKRGNGDEISLEIRAKRGVTSVGETSFRPRQASENSLGRRKKNRQCKNRRKIETAPTGCLGLRGSRSGDLPRSSSMFGVGSGCHASQSPTESINAIPGRIASRHSSPSSARYSGSCFATASQRESSQNS